MNLPVNFADKVQPSTCLAWTGAVQSSGYGSVGIGNGKTGLAHRVAWEHARGPIPEGMTVDHLCRFKLCVNVAHMELVSIGENTRRRYDRMDACVNGHELTPDNLIEKVRASGTVMRNCRRCQNDAARRSREKAKRAA